MKTTLKSKSRQSSGSCFIECALGGIIMVMVGLFVLNAIPLVIANQALDKAVYSAARAAASADKAAAQQTAANTLAAHPQGTKIIQQLKLLRFNYVDNHHVEVTAQMRVGLPAPMPFLPKALSIESKSIHAIVSACPVSF